jgi:predicted MFS family arabinose efflux permease
MKSFSYKKVTKQPMYIYLIVLTVASVVGLQGWRTLFNNFAVETAHLEGDHVGMIQSVREFPGFLALLAVYILMIIREHRLAALSILVMGAGIGVTGFFPSYWGLVFTTLLMSFGFHYYETVNQSLTLQYFDKSTSPWVFGKQRSYSAATNICVGLGIFMLEPIFTYVQLYLILAILMVLCGGWAFLQKPTQKNIIPQRKQMILRKKYWLFYALTFMAGARRQIFMAFAVFLMVKNFQFSVREITILFVVNNVINYFISPLVGRAIIRFGERPVLSLEYFSLFFIFLLYAVVQSKEAVALLYILDHIFFNFAIGIRTFFQKIGDPRDIAPSMAVGFTINHIAAVFLPALGGILWMIDYRIPFFAGAVMSLVSLVLVQLIRTPRRQLK